MVMKNILFVIAPKDFRDEELFYTKEILDSNNINTTISSLNKGTCYGMLGRTAESTIALSDVNADDFDGIVFVGGSGTPEIRKSIKAISLVKEFYNKGKLVCAICWAPTILAKAGVLQGKKATVWKGFDSEYNKETDKVLELFGAAYIEEGVVSDGNIITANGPSSAKLFGRTIINKLNNTI